MGPEKFQKYLEVTGNIGSQHFKAPKTVPPSCPFNFLVFQCLLARDSQIGLSCFKTGSFCKLQHCVLCLSAFVVNSQVQHWFGFSGVTLAWILLFDISRVRLVTLSSWASAGMPRCCNGSLGFLVLLAMGAFVWSYELGYCYSGESLGFCPKGNNGVGLGHFAMQGTAPESSSLAPL